MVRRILGSASVASVFLAVSLAPASSSVVDAGIGNVPQGTQFDSTYAASYGSRHVTNNFVTSRQVSCYRPEVPSPFNNGPNDGYRGETACPMTNLPEDIGTTPYPTQAGSRAPYPAATPMLVTDRS